MPKWRTVRDHLLYAHSESLIDDEEFILLFDLYTAKSPDLPYWKYDEFDLDKLSDDECITEFRFLKGHIYILVDAMKLPEVIKCYNGLLVDRVEALCIFLKRFAYPCRYLDMMPRFGRPVPQLCMISNAVMSFLYTQWNHLLSTFDQPWLTSDNIEEFCHAVFQKSGALENCFGFVDGTVRPICKPGKNQRVLYNGHKKVHAIKFQSLAVPNGLVANLFGPVEGKRHDSAMLAQSDLYNKLQQLDPLPNENPVCIYGDPAYPHRPQLQCPFKGARITPEQQEWNKAMSSVRVSVEWIFGDIVNYFKFIDFKKPLKIQLSAVGKMYICCTLLHNARCCFYGSITSQFFELEPPSINEYFV
ncbi:Hypothetical predicted protein [Paramuricea clavata]|uniref:Uncharacterized protein n=1 Tax=Paramuricea clavata TaxID=317549 RepID=A0A7D9JQJ8_PARCT|nr:Hypothetical predicted protein [Paramuricea clavata]